MPITPSDFSHRVLASAAPPGWRELAGAGVLFTVMAFAVFGWFGFHGGFVADDWVNASRYYLHPGHGFWGAVDNYQTPSRPVAAVYVSLTYAVLGLHMDQHLVLAVLLAAFLSAAFFAFLRTVGLGTTLALAAAALLLVFPSSDSTRLWTTGSQINLFIGLYLAAMVIAIAGRRRFGPAATPPAVAIQVLASTLAVTAVAGYEIVAPAVLLSVFLYRWIDRRGAVWRWLMDAVPTVLVLIFFTQKFGNGGAAHGLDLFTNARLVADGAISVLSYSVIPSREASRWLVLGGIGAVFVAVFLWRRRWFAPMVLAVVAIAVGYAMLIPAGDNYPPYSPGVLNRVNCMAALGICLLVVFGAAAIGEMVAGAVPNLSERTRGLVRGILAGALILGFLGIYTAKVTDDGDHWQEAAEYQAPILAGSHRLVPSPPPDATIFTSPYPGYSAPAIPIFGGGGNNDELSAFMVSYDMEGLRAFPLLEAVGVTCGARRIATKDTTTSGTLYGKAFLVDLRANRVYRPRSQAECVEDTAAMLPLGPIAITEQW